MQTYLMALRIRHSFQASCVTCVYYRCFQQGFQVCAEDGTCPRHHHAMCEIITAKLRLHTPCVRLLTKANTGMQQTHYLTTNKQQATLGCTLVHASLASACQPCSTGDCNCKSMLAKGTKYSDMQAPACMSVCYAYLMAEQVRGVRGCICSRGSNRMAHSTKHLKSFAGMHKGMSLLEQPR
jgi:hypothetical protein